MFFDYNITWILDFIIFCRTVSEESAPQNHQILRSARKMKQIMRNSSKIGWFLGPIFSEIPREKSIKIMLLLVLCGVNPWAKPGGNVTYSFRDPCLLGRCDPSNPLVSRIWKRWRTKIQRQVRTLRFENSRNSAEFVWGSWVEPEWLAGARTRRFYFRLMNQIDFLWSSGFYGFIGLTERSQHLKIALQPKTLQSWQNWMKLGDIFRKCR